MLIPHGGYSIPHLPGPGPERAQRPYRFVFALWYFFSSSWGRFGMLRERERTSTVQALDVHLYIQPIT